MTYNTPGTFDVTLEVTNIYGTSMTTQMGYIVAETVPTVDFDFTTDLGTVTFENLSQDADAYTWNFGDGNTSNEENPTHTYTEDGTYTVELTALNNCGASTLQQTVMVIVTGAEQVEWVESFNLYPNPNAGNFTLQMQGTPQRELQFTLYNAIGQLIKQDVEAFDTGRLNKQFNFDYLQAGVYTLGIRSGNSQLFVKVIIQ
ncbi:MAG: PKD domain-containing protein [Saprospiraceae bacterium]